MACVWSRVAGEKVSGNVAGCAVKSTTSSSVVGPTIGVPSGFEMMGKLTPKLPSQFAALAPKVREFFEQKAFGQPVDLSDPTVVKAMGTPVAHYVCVDVFSKALKKLAIAEQEPMLLEPNGCFRPVRHSRGHDKYGKV